MDNSLLLKKIASSGGTGAIEVETGPIISFNVPDNSSPGFKITQEDNSYISIVTTDGSEDITIGNATTNPTFSFLGAGKTSFAGDVDISGNLTYSGSAISIAGETVLFEDNYLDMNHGYTSDTAQSGGFAVNYDPTTTTDTVSAYASSSLITTVGSGTFSVGDIIMISGTEDIDNHGYYEVADHTTNTLTINTTPTHSFCKSAIDDTIAANSDSITKVAVSLLQTNTSGDWETAKGDTAATLTSSLSTITTAASALFTQTREIGTENISILTPATDAADSISLNLEGGGALMLTNSDGGIAGGNARGAGAVDLQVSRSANTAVAAADRSAIVGGDDNRIDSGSVESGIFAGNDNYIEGTGASYAFIGGGTSHIVESNHSAIVGGENHIIDTADSDRSVIAGGQNHTCIGAWSFIGGGIAHTVSASCSYNFIGGGNTQVITTGSQNGILGGQQGAISGSNGVILGGIESDITSANLAVCLGGRVTEVTAVAGVAMGIAAVADIPASFAIAANASDANPESVLEGDRGKSQVNIVHLDRRTIASGTVPMYTSGTSQITVPVNTAMGIQGKVICWNETNEKITTWNVDVDCYSAAASTLAFVTGDGLQTVSSTDDSDSPTLTISNTNEVINFNIDAGTTNPMRWSAALTITRAAT